MKFWDSSAVLALCLNETMSPSLRAVLEEDGEMVAWWATPVECWSALARLRRGKDLSNLDEERARKALAELGRSWNEVEPTDRVRRGAERALGLHDLRAADALQLAAALVWAEGQGAEHEFVCLDRRLSEAARREGFQVLPEK